MSGPAPTSRLPSCCCVSCNRVATSATLPPMVQQSRKRPKPATIAPVEPGARARPVGRGRSGVERIAGALDVVAARGWVSAAELATALGVDRSTGWRLARSLERVGWLHHDPATQRYRLGLPLFELGTRVLDTIDVRDEARRVMTELVATTGESVDLGIRDGDSVVFIDKIDGTAEVRAFTRTGQRARLHATAAGKVFLAAMPAAE